MERAELDAVLESVLLEARRYLAELDDAPVLADEGATERISGSLPETGSGAAAALVELLEAKPAATRSSGPRFFHFVTGGVTPAAFGADWLTTLLDQNSFSWVSSPLGARVESVAVQWLKELFELPASWGGLLTTGATTANSTAPGAARRWWGEQHGVDVDEVGLSGLPRTPVFSGGYVHSSAIKALGMLGLGRELRTFARDEIGRLDVRGLEDALRQLDGAPAILIGNAGDVNSGDFDPLDELADLAERYSAWLHVDGAFGLFARVSPQVAHLAAGIDRADSVIADGHKWLNVPYDCGFAFVREVVDRCLALARRLANRVEEAPDLELLAEAKLNIVCFRFRPEGVAEDDLDGLNNRL